MKMSEAIKAMKERLERKNAELETMAKECEAGGLQMNADFLRSYIRESEAKYALFFAKYENDEGEV